MKQAAREVEGFDASSFVVPKEYTCPISMELMVDPVVAQDGLTYERESIARWFSTGKTRSPVTNAELPDQTLIQNHAVRGMIEAYRGKVGDSMTKFIRGLAHSEASRARELARSPQVGLPRDPPQLTPSLTHRLTRSLTDSRHPFLLPGRAGSAAKLPRRGGRPEQARPKDASPLPLSSLSLFFHPLAPRLVPCD